MTQNPKQISFVITAHNEAPFIEACLLSLAGQQGFDEKSAQIVLVDDRSTDLTAEAAKGLGLPNLELVSIKNRPDADLTARQAALDKGFLLAEGDWVFVTDADANARPSWADSTLALAGRKNAQAVAGPVAFKPANKSLAARFWAAFFSVDSLFYIFWCKALCFMGRPSGFVFGNLAFCRKALLKAGGPGVWSFSLTEDLVFARMLFSAKIKVAYRLFPGVSVTGCPSLAACMERGMRIGAGGGFSWLFALLTGWMALLAFLGAGALFGPAWLVWLFCLRYLAGVFLVFALCLVARRPTLVWLAPFYEPLITLMGVAVLVKSAGKKSIHWAGIDYQRR
ncbi:MAG: glycosyltransferase [Desulfatibacillaceae bacterium]|nr:glycosyltransferase [Desulfatibacillaceae bacterium]